VTAYYEFGGVEFKPRAAEQLPLVSPGESFTSLRHVPYSNYNVLDLGGVGPDTYASEVRIANSAVGSFVALLQQRATLYVAGVNKGQATLIKLSGKTADPHLTYTWITAEWVLG
jgi:hypothetical protein